MTLGAYHDIKPGGLFKLACGCALRAVGDGHNTLLEGCATLKYSPRHYYVSPSTPVFTDPFIDELMETFGRHED